VGLRCYHGRFLRLCHGYLLYVSTFLVRLFDLTLTFFAFLPILDTGGSQLPWWALIVALVLSLFMFPFVCVIYAVTGFVSLPFSA